ncbi:MAG: hypothetical protein CSB28_02370, partial [Desulfobacterales bacterium]
MFAIIPAFFTHFLSFCFLLKENFVRLLRRAAKYCPAQPLPLFPDPFSLQVVMSDTPHIPFDLELYRNQMLELIPDGPEYEIFWKALDYAAE